MGSARLVACALLLLCPLALSRHDDDFAFDNSEEFQVELTANHSEISKNGLKRLWGVPDTSAYVGHLFRMEIPKEAFTGEVLAYKVRSKEGRRTPSWLAVDSKHGLISGVPQQQDVGAHTFTVTAHGRTRGLSATDSFTIEVKKAEEKPQSKYGSCHGSENRLILSILVDGAFQQISPRQRIRALMELASFMALDWDEFRIEPYKEAARGQTALMSGAGSSQRRRGDATTAIYLNVGCGERLWARHKVLVAGLREQARDGTLAHLVRLPVIGWRLTAVKPVPRLKRQSPSELDDGSGYDYDDDDDDEPDHSGSFDDEDDGDFYTDVDIRGPELVEPPPPPAPHPHRHHHGAAPSTTTDTFQTDAAPAPPSVPLAPAPAPLTSPAPLSSPAPPASSAPPPADPPPDTTTEEATSPEETTSEPATINTYPPEEEPKVQITPYSPGESASEANIVSYTLQAPRRLEDERIVIVPDMLSTSTEPETQTVIIRASNELPPTPGSSTTASPSPTPEVTAPPPPATTASTSTSTTAATTSTTTTSTTTTTTTAAPTTTSTTTTTSPPDTEPTEVTKQDVGSSSERSSTIFGRTTEIVTFELPAVTKKAPMLKHHMKKFVTTAGKAFRYMIPSTLFSDPEDEANFTYSMYLAEGTKLSNDSWIQFLPSNLEVYALPLETHVSRWNFMVEAQDSEGRTAQAPLDITVQHPKSARTVNHQFVINFKLNKTYTNDLDWQIRALEGIVNLLATDMHIITVLNVTKTGDTCEFVWTNDTLPKDSSCPVEDIKRLMEILETSVDSHLPSERLTRAMSPELAVSGVRWRGTGGCAAAAPATRAPDTYPPVTRNQVDMLTATVGHLLLYKVPEDTFFDPEDGGTRNLALSLRYMDRSALPASHWLQFDSRNQEFYGLPSASDVGVKHYQLIAEDSSKKSAYDSLIVEVVKAPTIRPTVEFQMSLEYPIEMLAENANNKRKIVEKLATLFEDKDTKSIRIRNITDSTTIIWYNTSLPMDNCPKEKIEDLRKMIIADDGALKVVVDQVFDSEKVMSITLIPQGLCAEQNSKIVPKTQTPSGSSNVANSKAGSAAEAGYTEYLVTFVIPAVVIVCMLLIAGIIACVLYRRRRTGKMSVGDDEERQAFRSKGIPVIFQDELEERGDSEPVHKSPVIMREEKPPLLPPAPDYRGEDAPYRPPPPFAASRTPPRPKATPTYRKPPPYVPP